MNENHPSKTVALIVSTMSSFMAPFMGSSVNIALPPIAAEFGANAVMLSWIATSYLLAAAVSLVPLGRLADIYGRKRIYLYGIILFTIASLFSAMAGSVPALIWFRVIQGFGNSMVFATGIAILVSVFPPQDRGKVIGINTAVVYTGLSLGPILGAYLIEHFTWRGIFLFNVPFGLAIIALVIWKLKGEWAESKGDRYDFLGAGVYSLALLMLMYGLSHLPSRQSFLLIGLGLIGLGFFVFWENRVAKPVFNMSLFKTNRVFAFSSLAALLNYGATFALTFFLSLYLQLIKGFSPVKASYILLSQPITMVVFALLAGWLSEKKEPRLVATTGMILTCISLVFFSFLNNDTSLTLISLNLILIGMGFGLFSSPNTNAIMSSVEKRQYGIASGSTNTMRLLGMMISMAIGTLVLNLYVGAVQITPPYFPAFIKAMRAAFAISALLCFVGIFASLTRGQMHGKPRAAFLQKN